MLYHSLKILSWQCLVMGWDAFLNQGSRKHDATAKYLALFGFASHLCCLPLSAILLLLSLLSSKVRFAQAHDSSVLSLIERESRNPIRPIGDREPLPWQSALLGAPQSLSLMSDHY